MRSLRLLLSVVAVFGLVLIGCGDDDAADPTPGGIGDDDTNATVPDDDDGAIGEDVGDERDARNTEDEDSQTDTTSTGADDIVPESNRALVNGDFAGGDLRLVLADDAACAIREADSAGGESAAEVTGATDDGDRFSLDWSTDAGTLTSEVVLDEVSWTADVDLDEVEGEAVSFTANGELLIDITYVSGDGEESDALLYVNCEPEAVG